MNIVVDVFDETTRLQETVPGGTHGTGRQNAQDSWLLSREEKMAHGR